MQSLKELVNMAKKDPIFWCATTLIDFTENLIPIMEKKGFCYDGKVDYEKVSAITGIKIKDLKDIFTLEFDVKIIHIVTLAFFLGKEVQLVLKDIDISDDERDDVDETELA